jgi:hypothetical protein
MPNSGAKRLMWMFGRRQSNWSRVKFVRLHKVYQQNLVLRDMWSVSSIVTHRDKNRQLCPCMIWNVGVVAPYKITEVKLVVNHLTTTLSAINKGLYSLINIYLIVCFYVCVVALTELILSTCTPLEHLRYIPRGPAYSCSPLLLFHMWPVNAKLSIELHFGCHLHLQVDPFNASDIPNYI